MTTEKTPEKKASFVPQEQLKVEDTNPPKREHKKNYVPEISVQVLPSKFLTYPEGATVSYQPYVFGEIKQFGQSKYIGRDRYEFILKGIECSFPKQDLTLADFLYLGLLRKISTLGGTDAVIHWGCSKCKKANTHIMKTNDIAFDDLDMPKSPLTATFVNGTEIDFAPITVEQFMILMDNKQGTDEVAQLAIEAINIEFEEAYHFIHNANQEDSEILDDIDEYLYHGVTPLDCVCAHCKSENIVEVDGGEILIAPFRKGRKSVKNRIRFGS